MGRVDPPKASGVGESRSSPTSVTGPHFPTLPGFAELSLPIKGGKSQRMVGMTKAESSTEPSGQRAVMVLTLV
jgi:hypothetical protein